MAQGYQLIQSQTLSSAAASVTFSNIPQNYSDLVLKVSARAVGVDNQLTFNGSTTSDSSRYLFSSGTATSSGSDANNIQLQGTSQTTFTANAFGSIDIYIPNYTASSNKSVSVESVTGNSTTESYQYFGAGIWSSSAAITSMTITNSSGNYTQHSTFQLYGIGGTRASGGTITADGNYTYHTFTSTGSFIPSEKIRNAEVLVIAGGGGGGNNRGGGGGAGGVTSTIGQTLIAGTTYTAVVGSGGTGSSGSSATNGSQSQFFTLSSVGGGGGGDATQVGASGGSGGGGGHNSAKAGGSGTSGQGFAGGNGDAGNYSGAGGGAASAGSNGVISTAKGGIGTSAYTVWGYATSTGQNISGTYYYAGGGGGATYSGGFTDSGGIGGGGNGGFVSTNATAATANTGGGGGGGGGTVNFTGGNGGSGLVIVRYPNN